MVFKCRYYYRLINNNINDILYNNEFIDNRIIQLKLNILNTEFNYIRDNNNKNNNYDMSNKINNRLNINTNKDIEIINNDKNIVKHIS